MVGAEDADLQYLGQAGCLWRAGTVLRKPREAVAIKHPLNFQQFGAWQETLQYLGVVSVGRLQVKLAVVAHEDTSGVSWRCALNTHKVRRDLRLGRSLALSKCKHTG